MTSSALRISALVLAAAAALAAPGLASAGGSVSIGVGIGGPGYYGGGWYGPRPYYGGYYGPRWYGPGPYYYGPPAVYAYPYPYPYTYPPAVAVVPAQPPVYVERDSGYSAAPQPAPQAQQPLESGFWYYCRNPAGYYPNVGECPAGWEKVPPRPPGAQ